MTDKRITEKYSDVDLTWNRIEFSELLPGDLFRLYEPDDGSPVSNRSGVTEFIATSTPYLKDGVMTIEVE